MCSGHVTGATLRFPVQLQWIAVAARRGRDASASWTSQGITGVTGLKWTLPVLPIYLWHQQGDSCDQQLESHAHQVGPNNPAMAWAELRGPIAPLPSCFVGLHIIPDSPGDDEKKRRRKVPLPVDYTAGLKVIHGVIQNRDPAEGWL